MANLVSHNFCELTFLGCVLDDAIGESNEPLPTEHTICPHCFYYFNIAYEPRWDGDLAFNLKQCAVCLAWVNRYTHIFLHHTCLAKARDDLPGCSEIQFMSPLAQ